MPTQYTVRAQLPYWQYGDLNWHAQFQQATQIVDGSNAVGDLAVTIAEIPSATLRVNIASGTVQSSGGGPLTIAGPTTVTLPASATTLVWLNGTGTVVTGTAWPTATHFRLATVTTSATAVTGIADARVYARMLRSGVGTTARYIAPGASETLGLTDSAIVVGTTSSGTTTLTLIAPGTFDDGRVFTIRNAGPGSVVVNAPSGGAIATTGGSAATIAGGSTGSASITIAANTTASLLVLAATWWRLS